MLASGRRIVSTCVMVLLAMGLSACHGSQPTPESLLKQAESAYEKAQYPRAAELARQAAALNDRKPDTYFWMGRIALQQRDSRTAAQAFGRAVALDPDHRDARLALAELLTSTRQYDQARSHIEQVLKSDARNVGALLLKSTLLLAQRQPTQAEAVLAELMAAGTARPEMYMMLASARVQLKDPAGAEQKLQEGIAKYPKEVRLQLALAGVHWQNGQKEQAQALLDKLVADDPKSVEKRVAAANFFLERRELAPAQKILTEGVAALPQSAAMHLGLSKYYQLTGQGSQAIETLRVFLGKEKPPAEELPAVHLALSQAYFREQQIEPAAEYAEKVLAQDSNHLDAVYLKGRIEAARGRADLAISAFKAVVERQPGLAEGYLQLAQTHAQQADYASAVGVLQRGVQEIPSDKALHQALARALIAHKDYKAAEKELLQLLKLDPSDYQTQAELGDFYLALKDASQAEREYAEIVSKFPDNPLGYVKLARLYGAQGNYAGALAELSKCYQRDERSNDLLAEMARMHIAAGDVDGAMRLCRLRLERNADDPFALNLQGQIYARQGKVKEAEGALQRAVDLAPQWVEPGNNLAALYLQQNRKEEAVQKLEHALQRNPRNPAAYLALGGIYEQSAQYPKAIGIYEQSLEKIPGFTKTAQRLAFLLCEFNQGAPDLERAHQLAAGAYQQNPGQIDLLDTLAWVYYHKGDYGRALPILQHLTEQLPDQALLNYHLGMVLLKAGKEQEARGRLEAALKSKTPFIGRGAAEQALQSLKAAG